MKNRGQPIVSMFDYRNAFTFPIQNFYGKVGLPKEGKEYEQLVLDYWYMYNRKVKDIPLMDGILEILRTLIKDSIKQYILSASDKRMINNQMSMYGLQDYFEEIIAPQDGYAIGKVELSKQWMESQNIPASDIIMIGDTYHDFETAMAINVDCALVDRGHQDLRFFKHDPNIIIYNDIKELADDIFAFKKLPL